MKLKWPQKNPQKQGRTFEGGKLIFLTGQNIYPCILNNYSLLYHYMMNVHSNWNTNKLFIRRVGGDGRGAGKVKIIFSFWEKIRISKDVLGNFFFISWYLLWFWNDLIRKLNNFFLLPFLKYWAMTAGITRRGGGRFLVHG